MDIDNFNKDLLEFLNAAPTPFHATALMAEKLKNAGFSELKETEQWNIKSKGRYFCTRNQSSIIAFTTGNNNYSEEGFRMVGAHTDSPCLKIKSRPELTGNECFQTGVEVYGGALLAPWFDRDLSFAGRVSWSNGSRIKHTLIDIKKAVATIPSLAIHLDASQNSKRQINAQTDITPLLAVLPESDDAGKGQPLSNAYNIQSILKKHMQQHGQCKDIQSILESELFLYDTQPAAVIGLYDDFIGGARLDNLLSCFTGLQALINAKESPYPALLVCNDHEETGSLSAAGAQGPFLQQVIQRLITDNSQRVIALQRSLLISADNAHAIHPNFPEKHDSKHAPHINRGPVIKINANQHYATNSKSSAVFRYLCEQENVPVQVFSSRNDMRCGSTIGSITAAEIGVQTLDVGLPTYGMHSIRELAGTKDAAMLARVLTRFYHTPVDQL